MSWSIFKMIFAVHDAVFSLEATINQKVFEGLVRLQTEFAQYNWDQVIQAITT